MLWGVLGAEAGLRPGGVGRAGGGHVGSAWWVMSVVAPGTPPASFDPVPLVPLVPGVGVRGWGPLEPTGPGAARVGLMLTKAPLVLLLGSGVALFCSVGICLRPVC